MGILDWFRSGLGQQQPPLPPGMLGMHTGGIYPQGMGYQPMALSLPPLMQPPGIQLPPTPGLQLQPPTQQMGAQPMPPRPPMMYQPMPGALRLPMQQRMFGGNTRSQYGEWQ